MYVYNIFQEFPIYKPIYIFMNYKCFDIKSVPELIESMVIKESICIIFLSIVLF